MNSRYHFDIFFSSCYQTNKLTNIYFWFHWGSVDRGGGAVWGEKEGGMKGSYFNDHGDHDHISCLSSHLAWLGGGGWVTSMIKTHFTIMITFHVSHLNSQPFSFLIIPSFLPLHPRPNSFHHIIAKTFQIPCKVRSHSPLLNVIAAPCLQLYIQQNASSIVNSSSSSDGNV